jgi:ribosomal protein S19
MVQTEPDKCDLTIKKELDLIMKKNYEKKISGYRRTETILPEYMDNTSAINGGIPLWGFYRTGGIIKVRLNETPPTMTLIGNNIILKTVGQLYQDPGVLSIAIDDGSINTYLISFISNSINYISNNILINNNTSIDNTNTLNSGTYILTYKATDSSGNISLLTRTVIYSTN